jgi:FMN phosphatase YigB (HAD superfamily)
VGCSKPSNQFFQHVYNQLGEIKKEDILIIGDSMSSDMLGGRNFGIDTCWFNPNQQARKFDVTFEITHLNELNKILL